MGNTEDLLYDYCHDCGGSGESMGELVGIGPGGPCSSCNGDGRKERPGIRALIAERDELLARMAIFSMAEDGEKEAPEDASEDPAAAEPRSEPLIMDIIDHEAVYSTKLDEERFRDMVEALLSVVDDINAIGLDVVVLDRDERFGGLEWFDMGQTYNLACGVLRAIGIPDERIAQQEWPKDSNEEGDG